MSANGVIAGGPETDGTVGSPMAAPLSIWLVEDEALYREPFRRLIDATDGFQLDKTFGQYEELQACLDLETPPPDLVVLDLNLPGASGIAGAQDLRRRGVPSPVVVLTTHDDPQSVVDAVRAGASGYVVKGTAPRRMLIALQEAYDGGTYFSPSVARHVLGLFGQAMSTEEALTGREVEVLRELAAGRSKAAIANVLFLSPHTVDSHLRAVYRKLHVSTAAAAAAAGVRAGLI